MFIMRIITIWDQVSLLNIEYIIDIACYLYYVWDSCILFIHLIYIEY